MGGWAAAFGEPVIKLPAAPVSSHGVSPAPVSALKHLDFYMLTPPASAHSSSVTQAWVQGTLSPCPRPW